MKPTENFRKYGKNFKFDITKVIGLTNDDEVSKEFRPYKQMIERMNRTFKETYRVSCGYDNLQGANNIFTFNSGFTILVKPELKVKLNKFLLQPQLLLTPTTNKSDQPVTITNQPLYLQYIA